MADLSLPSAELRAPCSQVLSFVQPLPYLFFLSNQIEFIPLASHILPPLHSRVCLGVEKVFL